MNDTLKDLITVAAYQKTLDEAYIDLSLNEKLENLRADLVEEIKNYGALITSDFSEVEKVFFPRGHKRSILQNLVSNSIKYRRKDQSPEVNISKA